MKKLYKLKIGERVFYVACISLSGLAEVYSEVDNIELVSNEIMVVRNIAGDGE